MTGMRQHHLQTRIYPASNTELRRAPGLAGKLGCWEGRAEQGWSPVVRPRNTLGNAIALWRAIDVTEPQISRVNRFLVKLWAWSKVMPAAVRG